MRCKVCTHVMNYYGKNQYPRRGKMKGCKCLSTVY